MIHGLHDVQDSQSHPWSEISLRRTPAHGASCSGSLQAVATALQHLVDSGGVDQWLEGRITLWSDPSCISHWPPPMSGAVPRSPAGEQPAGWLDSAGISMCSATPHRQ